MQPPDDRPTTLERLAAGSVNLLRSVGLSKLAYSSPMRRFGKRVLLREEKGPSSRVIASGLGKGLTLRVLPETPKSYWLGTHEPNMQKALMRNIKAGMVVYDCGANIGYFSAMLSTLVTPSGHVYSFEPSPQSLECLQLVSELNHFENLTVVPQAVWNQRETLRFACTAPNKSMVSDHIEGVFGEAAHEDSFVEIKTTSLDEFVYDDCNQPPNFIKMDIEGAEGKAMLGAVRLLSEHRPSLLLEIHGKPGREVWPILQDLNYKIVNIATNKSPTDVDEFAIWITQYLATPN
jgi:FkbM family methyltransferase